MKRMATFFTLVLLGYAGICLLIFLFQDRMLFFPRPTDASATKQLQPWQRIIETEAGTISGWVVPAKDAGGAALVFYFGGNAEDLSTTALAMTERADANVVFMTYRGYGESVGVPSQAALFSDALSIYDALAATLPHNGTIAALGRSLGSGVAVHLATQRRIDALILVTPYDSIRNVASRQYSWLPVAYLLKHPFDSLAATPMDVPALFVVAEYDTLIPPSHAKNLADHWGGHVEWLMIDDATHNSIRFKDYWATARAFFEHKGNRG